MKSYTKHGEGVEVPDLHKMYVEEAEVLLQSYGLTYEVIDSVYLRTLKPGEIAEQSPAPGTLVKKNRAVYLTTNIKQKRMVKVPNLVGFSARKVQSNLRAIGFNADNITYKAYEYNDYVLGLKHNGETVKVGESLPDGAAITLLVGRADSVQIMVPNICGLLRSNAVENLTQRSLNIGLESYDIAPTSDEEKQNYYVYHQTPAPGARVAAGKIVNIWLSKDANKKHEGAVVGGSDEEDFF
ncbi:MAG: PASTA domain-containing protein [bacterium]